METLGDPTSEILVINREGHGHLIEASLVVYLNQFHQRTITTIYRMNTEDGIRVSFNKSTSNTVHPQICFYPIGHPPEIALLHHPQEQAFVAVQKIEQIIGLREIHLYGLRPSKKIFAFDKRFWEVIEERELRIDDSHEMTQEDLGFFSADDTNIAIANKVWGLTKLAEKFGIPSMGDDPKNFSGDIAFYLEGYLNQYSPQIIYKRNMIDFFNYYSAITPEDIAFKSKALTCLQNSEDPFTEYNILLDIYSRTAENTEFKGLVVGTKMFPKHYKERVIEQERIQTHKTEIQRAHALYEIATQNYKDKSYDAAKNLSLDTLKIFSYHCTSDSSKLRNAYALVGYCFFKSQDFAQAKFFLEIAISLIQPNQKFSKEKHQSLINTLQECVEKLGTPSPAPSHLM
jgi:hypothetical protein